MCFWTDYFAQNSLMLNRLTLRLRSNALNCLSLISFLIIIVTFILSSVSVFCVTQKCYIEVF